jgi:hypothetical protein
MEMNMKARKLYAFLFVNSKKIHICKLQVNFLMDSNMAKVLIHGLQLEKNTLATGYIHLFVK